MRKWWIGNSDTDPLEPEHVLDDRTLPGVPDVFTGKDTTYRSMREMATEVRDETAQTQMERGLAISILAIIADFESYTNGGNPR